MPLRREKSVVLSLLLLLSRASWEVAADVPTRLARARCHLAAKKTVPSAPSSSLPLRLRRSPPPPRPTSFSRMPPHLPSPRRGGGVHACTRRARRHGAVIRNCYRPRMRVCIYRPLSLILLSARVLAAAAVLTHPAWSSAAIRLRVSCRKGTIVALMALRTCRDSRAIISKKRRR